MQTDSMIEFLQLVKEGVRHAEEKHPDFCHKSTRLDNPAFYVQMANEYKRANDHATVQTIEMVAKEELYEMLEAAANKNYKRAFLEAIDLAAVAIRCMEFYATEEAKTRRKRKK